MINYIVLGKNKHVVMPVLQAIRSFTDAKAVVIGSDETKMLRWSSLCEQHMSIRFDGSDDEAFVALINSITEQIHHVTLIPADCDAIRLTNRVRNRLALNIIPIPSANTLEMFNDKWKFQQFCQQHQIPVPETRRFESKSELDYSTLVAEFGLPFVVKPVNQAGAKGVKIVNSKAELQHAILNDEHYQYAPLVVQRFVEGHDIDISLLADRGQISAFAIQQASDATVRFVPHKELQAVASRLCQLSAFSGVMHIDARIDSRTGKLYLLESNPRFWASLNASVACGLNFVAESIQPTPRKNGALQLTNGKSYISHPLLHPSTWPQLFSNAGDNGRLLRAMAFDPVAIGSFASSLPSTLWRQASRQVQAKVKMTKKLNETLSGFEQQRLTKN